MSISPSKRHRVVILGGGYAGLTLAQRLSRRGQALAITLIDVESEFQQRIRLHQVAAGHTVRAFRYADFLGPQGIAFLQARVTALNPAACTLAVQLPIGASATLGYDYLIYALGSNMDLDRVAGAREHAQALQSPAAAQRVHAALSHMDRARVLVVGGGLTGIETAAELVESVPGLKVTLALDRPFCAAAAPGGYDQKAVDYLNRAFELRKVKLRSGARVTALRDGVAELSDGQEMGFDVCIWTTGFAPPGLAQASGILVNAQGQIMTDASLRSLSHPNIIAIGDAAQAHSIGAGALRMGSATALAMAPAGARTVLSLLAGREPPAFRFVYLFRNISLGRHDGLVQFVDRDDVPRPLVWTGALAAAWKEYICNSTLATVGLTRQQAPTAMPPLRMLLQLLRGFRQYA